MATRIRLRGQAGGFHQTLPPGLLPRYDRMSHLSSTSLLFSSSSCVNIIIGSTDHRGTPSFPGRTVTLNSSPDDLCWGVAYKLKEDDKQTVLQDLEFREKQYDMKLYLDFYTDLSVSTPAVTDVMVYYASPNKELNPNYLGPAPLEDIARQIIQAEGPSGPNRDYLFLLEEALLKFGCEDPHVRDLANAVRRLR
ncbi:Gamma-glutamylcyclotransferase [Rhynchospora pubera]|uniref:glutathione-specific gamma-glutamylcyclotransferase n=1 Tax=Rhynchospora pubera TaxID=906938 RepID=A0AAV8DF78_9POAL|nr:Gamma-glutamylcyclotransferase [Rhynchospora pubera]